MTVNIIFSEYLIKIARGLAVLPVLFWLSACGTAEMPSAHARSDDTVVASEDDDDDDSFEVADNISDKKLSTMRGGFITVGGLNINFGFSTTTTINGIVQSSLTLSSDNLNGSIPKNLQQVIVSGSGNQYVAPSALGNTVVTIVQNTLNNAVIQNSNILNLTVGNLSNFRNQMVLINSRLGTRY